MEHIHIPLPIYIDGHYVSPGVYQIDDSCLHGQGRELIERGEAKKWQRHQRNTEVVSQENTAQDASAKSDPQDLSTWSLSELRVKVLGMGGNNQDIETPNAHWTQRKQELIDWINAHGDDIQATD